LSNFH